jgi:hypothetical protein
MLKQEDKIRFRQDLIFGTFEPCQVVFLSR